MSYTDDTNAPIKFKGQDYKALTHNDIGALIESLPSRFVPRALVPFVSMTDGLRYGRSPFGLPELIAIVSKNSGHDHAKSMSTADQLALAGALTDRFYGFNPAVLDDEADELDEAPEPAEAFQEGPAS